MAHETNWPRAIGTALMIAAGTNLLAGAFAGATAFADPAVHETTTSTCCDPPDPFDPNFSFTETDKTLRTSPNAPEFTKRATTPTSHTSSSYTLTFSGSTTDPTADAITTVEGRSTNNTTLNYAGANAYTDRSTAVTTYADGTTETTTCITHVTRASAFSPKQPTTTSFTRCH